MKVDPKVYDNFKRFTKGKKKGEDIFHLLTTTELNSHLKTFMEGLSAKVFRTYNASFTLQEELKKVKFEKYELLDEKLQGMYFLHLNCCFIFCFVPFSNSPQLLTGPTER